jgi:hypothetical protein
VQDEKPAHVLENEESFYSYAGDVSYIIQGNRLLLSSDPVSAVDAADPGDRMEPMGWSTDGQFFAYWVMNGAGRHRSLRAAGTTGNVFLDVSIEEPDCKAYWSEDSYGILLQTAERSTLYSAVSGEMMNSTTLLPREAGSSMIAVHGSDVVYSIPEPDGRLSIHRWDLSWIEEEPLLTDLHGFSGACMTHPGSLFVHDGETAYLRVETIYY